MIGQMEKILEVIEDREKIRNVGVIAHIDHGKTTLTDSLLAGAGLIPYSLAGRAKVLDYLEEEQKRGITIKTANISLLYEFDGSPYVMNLVDTPGHVDFTGKVARVLRVIDGAIVVVDAVEEIMAQTEVVTRQALSERVKPVLFINKFDRLIKELKLNSEEIRRKISRIIQEFNNLIEVYCEEPFKDEWKISVAKGNVAFGSALHKWGLTFKTAKEKNIGFSDIIDAYKSGDSQSLQEKIPLHKVILDMVIGELPSPIEAQKYRIPKIWRGNLNSEVGRAMLECDPDGPITICITNVKRDLGGNLIAAGRVFSGDVKQGDKVYLLNAREERSIDRLWVYMGAVKESVSHVAAGNIAAFSGFEFIRAGETIVDAAYKGDMTAFEEIRYVSEPVVTVSLEPKNPADLPRLIEVMHLLSIEDPNLTVTISEETGEYLLSGVGELHLDIAIKFMKDYASDLEVIVSKPIIAYREGVSAAGIDFTSNSPNKRNQITVRVEPLEKDVLEMLESHAGASVTDIKDFFSEKDEQILAIEGKTNLLVKPAENMDLPKEDVEAIIDGFKWACKSGPLCGEPIRGIKVKLLSVKLHGDPVQRGSAQMTPAARKAIFGSFLTANPILLEPVYKIQITAPAEYIGGVVNLITKRRGKIVSIIPKALISVIDCYLPIAESLGLADDLRAVSSGRAFWQSMFSHWEKIPEEIMMKVIYSIRRRKGLPLEIPDPKKFIN